MSDAKTRPTPASVQEHLAAKADAQQRADCQVLMTLMEKLTQQPPRMWGPSIVGFGSYRYRYESGRTGEACLTGFAVRGKELVVYLGAESDAQPALLARLGKHEMGKACLYIKRLADLDVGVLESLLAASMAEIQRRHPA